MNVGRRDVLKLAAWAAIVGSPPLPADASAPAAASSPVEGGVALPTRPLMTLRLQTAATQDVGAGPYGNRVIYPIIGGTFDGERLRGTVLPGGDDWTVKRADGVVELDLRITLQTDDGALIYMTFEGIRDDAPPRGDYLRTVSRFAAADPKYAFLDRLFAVGNGHVGADGPVHEIEELL